MISVLLYWGGTKIPEHKHNEGSMVFIRKLIKNLSRNEDIVIHVISGLENFMQKNVVVHNTLMQSVVKRCDIIHIIGGPYTFRKFRSEYANEMKGKIVICHMISAYWQGLKKFIQTVKFVFIHRMKNKSLIIWTHLKMLFYSHRSLDFLNDASFVIVTCEYLKDWLVRKNVDESRIKVVYPSLEVV